MIPVRISFPGQLNNAIAATQSITATAGGGVVLNGSIALRSNISPSATTASSITGSNQPVVMAGVARPVTIFATTSATNCVFTVIGLDLRGNVITATINGASGGGASATVPNNLATTSGVDFHIVNGVVSSASVGNFTVGFGATGVTNFYVTDPYKAPFMVVAGADTSATLTTYTIETTYDNIQTTTTPVVATTGAVSNIATTTLYAGFTATVGAITGLRGSVSGNSASGGITFQFVQSG